MEAAESLKNVGDDDTNSMPGSGDEQPAAELCVPPPLPPEQEPSTPDFRSSSIAALRARAQQHSARILSDAAQRTSAILQRGMAEQQPPGISCLF